MSSNSYIIEIGTGRTTQPYDGRYVTTIGDPPPPDIGTGHYQPPPVPQGWQCPVCGRVYAPSQMTCPHSNEHAAAYLKIQLELDELRRMVKDVTK